ncbi:uncharacterized protein LOC125055778 [Pieris napi]|uniref:uncharacterized protein LOC125055778 n=1 Tax=Pieris napi TaxID=78633 RepID=UPI001FBB07FC|nr:uncharacterized protein LOC125055778 [Pieris napi]
MPQIFQVLRCYKCFIFQIHQTKKNYKWICKMCGEKQSIKRHYGIGSGKECRLHVQKLNKLQSENHTDSDISDSEKSDSDLADATEDNEPIPPKKVSKWSHYTDENDVDDPFYINCREKEEIPKKSEKKIFYDKDQFNNDGSVIKQYGVTFKNNQNKGKYESTKFIKPSSNKQEHSFNESNKSSEWATFVENNSQESAFIHGDNICVENKFLNKETVNSSSKWVEFLDNKIDENCIEQHTNKIICKESNIAVKANNSPTKDKISHGTNKILLNLKQSDKPGISKATVCKESLFSMSDDQDLDSILDL